MARARDPNRDVAKRMYLESNGEKPIKDIAIELSKDASLVRKWKRLDKWDDELNGHVSNETKGHVSNEKQPNRTKKKADVEEKISLIENDDLTDKQRLFCLYYVKMFNATKAYRKAYESTLKTADANGPRLLGNARVKEEIQRLKQHRMQEELFDKYDVLQRYKDIAYADIADYVERNDTGYSVTVKDFDEIDTTLISEVSNTENGIKMKLLDKMKALDVLAKYTNLLSEQEIKQLQTEQQKMKNIQMERELGGNQHKADPFENLTTEELKQIINEL